MQEIRIKILVAYSNDLLPKFLYNNKIYYIGFNFVSMHADYKNKRKCYYLIFNNFPFKIQLRLV